MNDEYLQRVPRVGLPDATLWWVNLDECADVMPLNRPSMAEAARAGRMASRRDARRFLTSHGVLRLLLAEALGRSPDQVDLPDGELGKPRLSGGELHFNLSRSGAEALIGLSRDRAIGVDIEWSRDVPDADALARQHFTDAELSAWLRAEVEMREELFLRGWTRKEACLKALGLGLSLPPAGLSVGCGGGLRAVDVKVGLIRARATVVSVTLPTRAVGAVATASPDAEALASHPERQTL